MMLTDKPSWAAKAMACMRFVFAPALFSALAISADSAAAAETSPKPLQVVVGTIDGKTASGALTRLSVDGIEITGGADAQPVKLSASTLQSVTVVGDGELQPERRPTLVVALVDGSQLAATGFQASGGKATVQLAGKARTSIPLKRIDWVRFRPAADEDPFAAQWAEILAGTSAEGAKAGGAAAKNAAAADVLVIRKKTALDYLEGVAGAIDDESVVFEVDHDQVNVKRAKIEGLIFYRPNKEELTEAAAVLSDRGGSRLQVASLALTDGGVKVTTPGGQEIEMPAAELTRLDFSSANTQFISDLEPERYEYVSFFDGKDQPASLAEFYKPRRDVSTDQNPLKLDGKTFAKGLSVHARTKAVYRLPGKFVRFSTVAGIDDALGDAGSVRLEIRGDGKMLWEGTLKGAEPARLVDVSVQGVKRLEMLVDFGDGFESGDVLDLCDAKVTR